MDDLLVGMAGMLAGMESCDDCPQVHCLVVIPSPSRSQQCDSFLPVILTLSWLFRVCLLLPDCLIVEVSISQIAFTDDKDKGSPPSQAHAYISIIITLYNSELYARCHTTCYAHSFCCTFVLTCGPVMHLLRF